MAHVDSLLCTCLVLGSRLLSMASEVDSAHVCDVQITEDRMWSVVSESTEHGMVCIQGQRQLFQCAPKAGCSLAERSLCTLVSIATMVEGAGEMEEGKEKGVLRPALRSHVIRQCVMYRRQTDGRQGAACHVVGVLQCTYQVPCTSVRDVPSITYVSVVRVLALPIPCCGAAVHMARASQCE